MKKQRIRKKPGPNGISLQHSGYDGADSINVIRVNIPVNTTEKLNDRPQYITTNWL